MPANVRSLEALDGLRMALITFIDQVTDALAELDAEMRRMMEWLEHDRPKHWKSQLRKSRDHVHEAQQALHRCLMFPIAGERPACTEERSALKQARARQAYCEEKVERVRHWQRAVEHELFDYRGRVARLVRMTEVEVPQALGVLQKIVRQLEEYHSVRAADPHAAYNDVAMVKEIWPEKVSPLNEADDAADANDENTPIAEATSPTDFENADLKEPHAEAQGMQSE